LLVWTATVYLGRGDLQRARELTDQAWALAGLDGQAERLDVHVVVPAHIGRTACLVAEGRCDEAVEIGEAGVVLADRAGYVFWSLHILLPLLGEAHLRRRDLESARRLGRRMREEGARIGHRLATAWADACDAIVHWLSGDVERSIDLLRGGAEALEAIPWVYDAARIRRQLAGRLAELGRNDEALQELRRVHDTFARLGAQPELEATRTMFREIDARPPVRTGDGTADLTGREWEIARLVARRMSSKAIAKELNIRERTVTTHLSNMYKKLGIHGKTELGDLVREGRLAAPAPDGS
jgi:DNA-binding CsgD family transcriptional regulator